ncbi:UNVERIFIED_CONTAM: hypothetical protein NY603_40595, partial [Bacteroidetes bacterium 56_B9]
TSPIMYIPKALGLAVTLLVTLSNACPIVERVIATEEGDSSIEARQSCPTKYDYSQGGRDWHTKCAGKVESIIRC